MHNVNLPTPPPIYLDHHATTPVDPRVVAVISDVMTTSFGNANSVEHVYGEVAADQISIARREVGELVGAEPEGVHFTSGSTESIWLAIAHAVASRRKKQLRVALSTVEHKAVQDAVKFYEQQGDVIVRWIPVDEKARLDMTVLKAICQEGIDLVCVMAANNEVGTIYPIADVVRLLAFAGAKALVDATQAVGHFPLTACEWGIAYLTLSAHKIYGPKGIGALVVPAGFRFGSGEWTVPGKREGTPNVPGIVGFGKACQLLRCEMSDDEPRMEAQRNRLQELLVANIKGLVVNGDIQHRLANNLHVSVPSVPNDVVIARLRHRVALSSGSACSSATQTPSHVLQAMGLSEPLQEGSLRIGIGKFTTDDEISRAAMYISEVVVSTQSALGR
ncbi:MAG: cysteine desulfurase family protein [Caldilineaceae bacterium]|nr:cysteine desulfurase family protein [Caldilineaceae bacterium]